MSTFQQLLRIVLGYGAAFFFGDGAASSELGQQAISGGVAIGVFVWWMFENAKSKDSSQ